MSLPYSELFIKTVAAQTWRQYAVPSGMRAVVRAISVANVGGIEQYVQVKVAGVVALHRLVPAAADTQTWEVRWPVYGGEVVEVWQGATGTSTFISGFLFQDPTGAIGPPHGPLTKPDPPDPDLPPIPRGGDEPPAA